MPITPSQVEQAIMVIEKRLNGMGTAEPLIARQGTRWHPAANARRRTGGIRHASADTLEKVAKLELREVSPRNDEVGPDGKTLAARVLAGSEIIPGYRAFELQEQG